MVQIISAQSDPTGAIILLTLDTPVVFQVGQGHFTLSGTSAQVETWEAGMTAATSTQISLFLAGKVYLPETVTVSYDGAAGIATLQGVLLASVSNLSVALLPAPTKQMYAISMQQVLGPMTGPQTVNSFQDITIPADCVVSFTAAPASAYPVLSYVVLANGLTIKVTNAPTEIAKLKGGTL